MKYFFTAFFLSLQALSLSAQTAGDAFFSEWTVHEIRFQFSQPGYWDSLKANYILDEYMRCDVQVDGVSLPNSGVKFKGNSSYNNPSNKKPFRIDLAEYVDNQSFDGLKKLVLNNAFKDPTFLREKLMLDFMNQHGINVPRATFARLYLNGKYWGLYSVVEDVNKTFLEDRFGNKDGNLFKGDPKGTLVWKGAQQSLYESDYELKTNETENNWSDLIGLLNALNNSSNLQLADSLGKYMNLESWFSYWAAHNLFVNLDSYIGSGHNYFLYHNSASNKFEWITWDVNEAFGNFQMGMPLANIKTLPYGFIPQPGTQRPIMNRLWTNSALKQQYSDRLCDLLADFNNQKMDARIDSLANLIRTHVYADSLNFFTNNQFEQNLSQDLMLPNVPGASGIAGLKNFISARNTSLKQQLSTVGCNTSNSVYIIDNQSITVYPNPNNGHFWVSSPGQEMRSIALRSLDGKVLLNQKFDKQFVFEVNHFSAPPGMYLVTVETEKGWLSSKLCLK